MEEDNASKELNKKIENESNTQGFLIILICGAILLIIFLSVIIILNKSEDKSAEKNELNAEYKPVIYLYPTEETEVTVKVGRPENLTHTYPKYVEEWKVIA